MTIEETYNIHKKINCVFRFFKSKLLCKHNLHNFELRMCSEVEPITKQVYDRELEMMRTELVEYSKKNCRIYWKCRCCGKEEKFEEDIE